MAQDNLKKLHENLAKKNPKFTRTYDEFVSDMNDAGNRERLYSTVSKTFDGFNRTPEEFSADMGFGQTTPAFEVPLMFDKPKAKEQASGVVRPEAQPKEDYALAPELKGKLEIKPTITRSTNEFDDIDTGVATPESVIREQTIERDPYFITSQSAKEGIKEMQKAFDTTYDRNDRKTIAASINYSEAKDIYEEADKALNAKGGFFSGAGEKASDPNTWFLGIPAIAKLLKSKSIIDKLERGEKLEPHEEAILDATATLTQANIIKEAETSNAYKGGEQIMNMVPLITQMIATGGIGKVALAGGEKALVKYLGSKIASKMGLKLAELGVKAGTKIATGALGAVAAPMTAQGTLEQMQGQVKADIGDDNNLVYNGRQNEKDLGDAYLYAAENTFKEFATELSGGSLGVVGKVMSAVPGIEKLFAKVAESGFGKVGKAIFANDYFKKAGIHGFLGEYNEEFDGALYDHIRGKENINKFFNWDMQAQLLYTLVPVSMFGGAVSLGAKVQGVSAFNIADKQVTKLLEAEGYGKEDIETIKMGLLDASPKDAGNQLSAIVGTMKNGIIEDNGQKGINNELVQPFLNFMVQGQKQNAINQGLESRKELFNQEVEQAATQAIDEVNAQINPVTGTIVRATINGKETNINGRVSFLEDGTLDVDNTDETLSYVDENNEVQAIAAKDLVSPVQIDPAQAREVAANNAAQPIIDQQENEDAPEYKVNDEVRTKSGLFGKITKVTPQGYKFKGVTEKDEIDLQGKDIVNDTHVKDIKADDEVEYIENGQPMTGIVDDVNAGRQAGEMSIDGKIIPYSDIVGKKKVIVPKSEVAPEVEADKMEVEAPVAEVDETPEAVTTTEVVAPKTFREQVPTKVVGKKTVTDYESATPEITAGALKESFPNHAEIIDTKIADFEKQIKSVGKVKVIADIDQYEENVRKANEKVDTLTKQLEYWNAVKTIITPEEEIKEPTVDANQDYYNTIASSSNDIDEIVRAYNMAMEESGEQVLLPWQAELMGKKVHRKSFTKYADRNYMKDLKPWLLPIKSTLMPSNSIDTIAAELSDLGIEVSTSDVVNFMLEYPEAKTAKGNENTKALDDRFRKVATKIAGIQIGGIDTTNGRLFIRMNGLAPEVQTQINEIAEQASEVVDAEYLDFIDNPELNPFFVDDKTQQNDEYDELADYFSGIPSETELSSDPSEELDENDNEIDNVEQDGQEPPTNGRGNGRGDIDSNEGDKGDEVTPATESDQSVEANEKVIPEKEETKEIKIKKIIEWVNDKYGENYDISKLNTPNKIKKFAKEYLNPKDARAFIQLFEKETKSEKDQIISDIATKKIDAMEGVKKLDELKAESKQEIDETFDWAKLFEENKATPEEIESNKQADLEAEYQQMGFDKKWAPTRAIAIQKLNENIAKNEAIIKDWSARVYKKSGGKTVEVGNKNDDYDTRNVNVDAINERKRANVIKNAQSEIADDKKDLKRLDAGQVQLHTGSTFAKVTMAEEKALIDVLNQNDIADVKFVTTEEIPSILDGTEQKQSDLPETIDIDGVQRHTTNSGEFAPNNADIRYMIIDDAESKQEDKLEFLRGLSQIETGETRIDDAYESDDAEYEQRKVYIPVYVNSWDYADNTNPDITKFDDVDEALSDLINAGRYDETSASYTPTKSTRLMFTEAWVDKNGDIVDDNSKLLVLDDISDFPIEVKSQLEKHKKNKWDDVSDIDTKTFEAREDSARELETSVYLGINGDIIPEYKGYKITSTDRKKYRDIVVSQNGEEVHRIQLRIADHSYNPRNNDDSAREGNFISVEIANKNATLGRFNGAYGIQFDGTNTYNDVVEAVNERVKEIIDNKFFTATQFMQTPTGTIYGAVKNGVVYINTDTLNLNTPIHEFGHIFIDAIEGTPLFNKGAELIKQSVYFTRLANDPNYSHLSENGRVKEAMAAAIGDNGAQVVKDKGFYAKLKAWIADVWKRIGAKAGIEKLTSEQISNLTLQDFIDITTSEVLSGKKVESVDARYMAAIERGDIETAQKIVDKQAEDNGYVSNQDYRLSHRAPSADNTPSEEKMDVGGDFSLTEIANGYSSQPLDYFDTRNGARWYGYDYFSGRQSQSAINSAIRAIKAGENPTVTIYRAVEKSLKEGSIRNGDWVTLSEQYAKEHGQQHIDGAYRIIKQEVPANEVWWDGNDINEWGYDNGESYSYKDTKNNRKLNDVIVRDEKGDIIPPSKRFNSRTNTQYQIIGEQGASNLDKAEEATTRLDNLRVAKEMEAAKTPKEIRLATGWERGTDSKWRYEVADGKVNDKHYSDLLERKFNEDIKSGLINATTLGELYDSKELYSTYPELENIQVILYEDENQSASASYNPSEKAIYIYNPLSLKSIEGRDNSLIHEIQHAIQAIEGFAKGGNEETGINLKQKISWSEINYLKENGLTDVQIAEKMNISDVSIVSDAIPMIEKYGIDKINNIVSGIKSIEQIKNTPFYNIYNRLAGETEARNASTRMNFTEEERRQALLSETEDVAREDQIVIYDSVQANSEGLAPTGENAEELNARIKRKSLLFGLKLAEKTSFIESVVNQWTAVEQMENFLKEKGVIVTDSTSFFNQATHVSGRVAAWLGAYENAYLKPLQNTIHDMTKIGVTYQDVEKYAMIVHGLEERNPYFNDKNNTTDVDYSGITAFEAELGDLQAWKADFESKVDKDTIDKFWKKVKENNDFVLDQLVRTGQMSKEAADELKTRWNKYVPLRGFDAVTAEDVHDYTPNIGVYFTAPMQKIKGRTSIAETPFAYMRQMAQSAIVAGEKNIAKQAFGRLARIDTTGIIRPAKSWYQYVGEVNGVKEFEAVEATYNEDPEVFNQNIIDFEDRMQAMRSQGLAFEKNEKQDFGVIHIKKQQKEQHAVRVLVNGKESTYYIMSDPRIARAINGNSEEVGAVLKGFRNATSVLGQIFTSKNPEFVLRNAERDFLFSMSTLPVKEGWEYTGKFSKNILRSGDALRQILSGNAAKLQKNNPELYKLYQDYVFNGGKTGYFRLFELKKTQKNYEDEVKKGDKKNVGKVIFDTFSAANEFAETINRFAAFITSIEDGRTMIQSINDAKNLTVNFDMKGTGKGAWKYFKSLYLFQNVAVQALSNFTKLGVKNPKGLAALVMSYAMIGVAEGFLMSLLGGDDGLEDYIKINPMSRRNNFNVYGGNTFTSIFLPQELRVFKGLGSDMFLWSQGRLNGDDLFWSLAWGVADLLPMNPAEIGESGYEKGVKGVVAKIVPDVTKPIVQHALNVNFMNDAVVNEFVVDRDIPGYKKGRINKLGKPYAPAIVYDLSKWLNYSTGGDDVVPGEIIGVEPSFNPDLVNHYMSGYFGGIYKLGIKGIGTTIDIAKGEELELRDTPASSFFTSREDLRERSTGLNNDYYEVRNEVKTKFERENKYRKEYKGDERREKIYKLGITERDKDIKKLIRSIERNESKLDEVSEDEQKTLMQTNTELKKVVIKMSEATK